MLFCQFFAQKYDQNLKTCINTGFFEIFDSRTALFNIKTAQIMGGSFFALNIAFYQVNKAYGGGQLHQGILALYGCAWLSVA